MNEDQTPDNTDDQATAPDEQVAEAEVQADQPTDSVPQAPQVVPAVPTEPATPAPIEFSWQASEYVQHHKNPMWYVFVGLGVVVLSAAGVYLLKSWLSIALFVVIGITLMVYGHRPPRTLTYELSADGLRIDGKLYPYHTFRSFSVLRDISWHSIDLEPTQRFMPRLSVLFNDDDFDAIVEHLLGHLPRVDRAPDFVERATRYLRF